MVSSTDLGIDREGPVERALYLPYFAATVWYHEKLDAALQSNDLEVPLPEEERETLIARCAYYSSLSSTAVRQHNLAAPTDFFWKELLRDEGLTIGRLDPRYRGLEASDADNWPDFDPALSLWNHAFAPAVNYYLREVLGDKTDLEYWLFGPVHPWNREGNHTGESLQRAMTQSPYLHIMVQSGYFDGGTDFFNAKYTLWNMDPASRFQDRMTWKGYRSGHMMYLRKPDLEKATADIRTFIKATMPSPGEPAKR